MKNYIVVSDLHLGENVHEATFANQPKIEEFAQELEALGDIEEIIFLGDFLELALAPLSKVTRQMAALFKHIYDIPKKLVYVPGNHDHHIWTLHVEQKIIENMKEGKKGSDFKPPSYIDAEFVDTDSFLSGYLPETPKNGKWVIKYPIHEISMSSRNTCLLHHGHQIYGVGVRLLSLKEVYDDDDIPEDEQMLELELQNIGIYELLWFYLELSGVMRRRVEREWKEGGGFAAFSVVAKEMADKRVLSAGHRIYRMFRNKPKERGKTIGGAKKEIRQYLKVCNKAPRCFIYGHSHVPELVRGTDLDKNLPKIIGNCGSWLNEGKRNQKPNTYIVINEDGVDLRRLGEGPINSIEW